MTYLIIDRASNICFNSDIENFIDMSAASEVLDYRLRLIHGEDCDIDAAREGYTITRNVLYQFD